MLGGAQYFTKIDLWRAYNLVCIAPGEEWKTVFQCWFEHFEYKVMPFGLTNTPGSFQVLIIDTLRLCLDRFACAYLDNIIVYSKTLCEYRLHVQEILKQLQSGRMFVQKEKSEFHRESIEFLDFVIERRYI